jgi:4-amino-4-deoxy-L-arabinose transferase-like glycosyltransferase
VAADSKLPQIRARGVVAAALLAALLFLPWLGSTGLWDPWEPHYAEVSREMIVRDDWVHPYWESAWFFSKPALLLWTSALGLEAVGVNDRALPPGSDPTSPSPSGISTRAEWGARLPVALLAIAACALTCAAVSRLLSRRAGLLAATALATTPFYALLARQATPDMPFVALMTGGTLCFAVALWDERAHRTAWAYGGYLLLGLATLAKGLLGFALPGAAFLLWAVVSGDWQRLSRLRLVERVRGLWIPVGPILFLLVAAPWYLAISFFRGVDDEGKTFAERFWLHDHLRRLGQGVHSTTPGGTFEYFVEQLGWGIFPWVAALPGGLGEVLRLRARTRDPAESFTLFAGLWAVLTYVLMSLSATKFHHYIFPAVPALAILCAAFVDRILREGTEPNAVALLLGFAAYAVVAHGLAAHPKALSDLVVYNYERPWPERELLELHPGIPIGGFTLSLAPRAVMTTLFAAGGVVLVLTWVWESRRALAGSLVALALAFALWLSWFHWRELSPHWSQRDLFRTYLAERASPGEPVAAYYMNWRGETFYSRNLVRQVQDDRKIREWAARPGRKWIVTERGRYAALRAALGREAQLRIADRSSNKYYLVALDDPPPQ